MQKRAGVSYTLMDYFNLLLLPLLVLAGVSMLIWVGIYAAWWMITSSLNRLIGKRRSCFLQDYRDLDK